MLLLDPNLQLCFELLMWQQALSMAELTAKVDRVGIPIHSGNHIQDSKYGTQFLCEMWKIVQCSHC